MSEDTYKTIAVPSEGIYTEKRSKFIAIALPVRTVEEVKAHLETYQKKYYDARHVCYAYMLGHERKDFRANDNGEPSGTATLLRLSPNYQYHSRPTLAVTAFKCSRLSWLDGRCVQGPGTYSPRHG